MIENIIKKTKDERYIPIQKVTTNTPTNMTT